MARGHGLHCSGTWVTPNIAWEGCRDRFQSSTNADEVMDFLFFHAAGTEDHVIEFLRTIEEIIKNTKDSTFTDDDRLQFRRTNNANVLHVKMSKWWKYAGRRAAGWTRIFAVMGERRSKSLRTHSFERSRRIRGIFVRG